MIAGLLILPRLFSQKLSSMQTIILPEATAMPHAMQVDIRTRAVLCGWEGLVKNFWSCIFGRACLVKQSIRFELSHVHKAFD